jgi:hypothetical protein
MTDTLKVESNVARAPIFAPESGLPIQLALEWPLVPYERAPFRIVDLASQDGPLTIPDLAVFAHLCTRYLWSKPDDRRVPVSLAEIARWLGHDGPIGGKQRARARASIRRLCAARFESTLRNGTELQAVINWGLLEEAGTFLRGPGRGYATITTAMTAQLQAGQIVLLDGDAMTALLRRNPLACRLWVYLESQRLVDVQRFGIYAAPEGYPPAERRLPAIADLLRLRDRRRRTVARIRRACVAIAEIDPRYQLDIESAKSGPGMWNLAARRVGSVPPGHGNRYPQGTAIGTPRARNLELGLTLSTGDFTLGDRYPQGTAGESSVVSTVEITVVAPAREEIARLRARLASEPSAEMRGAIRTRLEQLGDV